MTHLLKGIIRVQIKKTNNAKYNNINYPEGTRKRPDRSSQTMLLKAKDRDRYL